VILLLLIIINTAGDAPYLS